ncbi:MAG: TlpA family protein disulfide reductase [Polyangiaceae bacterium]|nr:TlpA family protein disulfide reductase [Polyangiaceae bacterium]
MSERRDPAAVPGSLPVAVGLLAAVGLWVVVGCAPSQPATAANPAPGGDSGSFVGSVAPAIEELVVSGAGAGEPLDWAALFDHVVVVEFWANWCAPCRRSMPYLQALVDRDPEGLRVIGVNEDDREAPIADFARRYAIGFPLVWDDGKVVADAYRVTGLPTTVVVDRDGVVRDVRAGLRSGDAEALEASLAELMAR